MKTLTGYDQDLAIRFLSNLVFYSKRFEMTAEFLAKKLKDLNFNNKSIETFTDGMRDLFKFVEEDSESLVSIICNRDNSINGYEKIQKAIKRAEKEDMPND